MLFVGVFPSRTYLDQRSAIASGEESLDEVVTVNEELEARIDALDTDAEIERLARREYNLVYPGQEAYAILPPPPEPVSIPDVWPFSVIAAELGG